MQMVCFYSRDEIARFIGVNVFFSPPDELSSVTLHKKASMRKDSKWRKLYQREICSIEFQVLCMFNWKKFQLRTGTYCAVMLSDMRQSPYSYVCISTDNDVSAKLIGCPVTCGSLLT